MYLSTLVRTRSLRIVRSDGPQLYGSAGDQSAELQCTKDLIYDSRRYANDSESLASRARS